MSYNRYLNSLTKLKNYGSSLDKYAMEECLRGLFNHIPDLWKKPRFIGIGGNSAVAYGENEAFGGACAVKFLLPSKAKEGKKTFFFEAIERHYYKTQMLDIKKERENRFRRGWQNHRFYYKILKKNNLQRFGYIPEPYSPTPGEDKSLHYAMEYIDGYFLLDWCKKASTEEKLKIFLDIMYFVHVLFHENGGVHRDLKIDNIMVTKTGLPVIIDFGLVKNITDDSQDITHENSVLGTDKWSSPEQLGSSKRATRKADVWTLGLSFWSMMVGENPQVPRGLKIGEDIQVHEIFPISRIPGNLEEFKDFFEKATRPDPDLRFPNLEVAMENYQKSLNYWYKRHNQKVSKVVNQTTINNTYSKIDWKAAKEWAKDDKQKNCILDICLGLEWLFFKERE